MAGFAPTGGGSSGSSVQTGLQSISPQLMALDMPIAGIEYELELPASTTQYTLRTRSGSSFQLRLVSGSVEYLSVPRYVSVSQTLILLSTGASLFITNSSPSDVLEAFVWLTPP